MNMLRHSRGQVALVLILLSAIALIFFAMTLNWGKIAQTKAQITIAANTASASMASSMASYGQQVLQQTLGGSPSYCDHTSVWIALIVTFFAVVLAVWTGGASLSLLLVALAVVNVALQVTVVQPGLTDLWNKLQNRMSNTDQFLERGVSTALQAVVNDPVMIPDYFDLNVNGKLKGNSNDKISRYAFFYTERLKMLQPRPPAGIRIFMDELKGLTFGKIDCSASVAYVSTAANNCTANPAGKDCAYHKAIRDSLYCSNSLSGPLKNPLPPVNYGRLFSPNLEPIWAISDPKCSNGNVTNECNPCCVPVNIVVPNPLHVPGSTVPSTIIKSIRPVEPTCNDDSFPIGCVSDFPGNDHQYTYNPAAENMSSAYSFRAKLGRDDETRDYKKLASNPVGTQVNETDNPRPFRMEDATSYYTPAPTTPVPATNQDGQTGIYPLLSKMTELHPRIDNIVAPGGGSGVVTATSDDCHWCSTRTAGGTGLNCFDPAPGSPPVIKPGAPQLVLTSCQGADCCVNKHANGPLVTDIDARVTDYVQGTDDYRTALTLPSIKAADNQCAVNPPVGTALPYNWENLGFQWKQGADRYCSSTWPYEGSCPKTIQFPCTESTQLTCGCFADPDKSRWTEDPLESMTYGLNDFVRFTETISQMSIEDAEKTFIDWYPQAAAWVAPKCDTPLTNTVNPKCPGDCSDKMIICNNDTIACNLANNESTNQSCIDKTTHCAESVTCSTALGNNAFYCSPICNPNEDGILRKWKEQLGGATGNGGWLKILNDWVKATSAGAEPLASATAWCVPANISQTIGSKMSPSEKAATFTLKSAASLPTSTAQENVNKLTACLTTSTCASTPSFCDSTALAGTGVGTTFNAGTHCNGTTLSTSTSFYANVFNVLQAITNDNSNYEAGVINQKGGIDSSGKAIATVKEVAQCLGWNQNNDARFQACIDKCSNPTATDWHECRNLPRSLVAGFDNIPLSIADPSVNQRKAAKCLIQCNNINCGAAISALGLPTTPSFNETTMCNSGNLNVNMPNPSIYASIKTAADAASICKDFSKMVQSQKLAVNQGKKFAKRHLYLKDLADRAVAQRDAFERAYTRINDFLYLGTNNNGDGCNDPLSSSCPAWRIMDARRQLLKNSITSLPNYVIYGWQSTRKSKDSQDAGRGGYWHVAVVESYTTGRCYGKSGCVSTLPWVESSTHGTFATERCYDIRDTDGKVGVKVTRWDEDHAPSLGVRFANLSKLWNFRFGKPNKAPLGSDNPGSLLTSNCKGLVGGGAGYKYVGMLPSTQEAIYNLSQRQQIGNEELIDLRGAFMISTSGNPAQGTGAAAFDQPKADYETFKCYQAIQQFIHTGVSSASCAKYFLEGNRLSLRFEPCGDFFPNTN